MQISGRMTIIDKGALSAVAEICGTHIHEFGQNVVERARENTREFKGHKSDDPKLRPTGTLMRSIVAETSKGGLQRDSASVTIRTRTGYGAYVELGTRRMAAQPYMAPGFAQAVQDFEASGPWA